MSDGRPIPWQRAAEVTAAFVKLLGDVSPLRVCGSLRRKKASVGDVEIVACPDNRAALLARLDKLIVDGICQKAVYSNGTHRWGDTYRGLMFRDIRFEIFNATPDNLGYIAWLRTGPGDANTYVMQNIASWPIRFDDGSAWHTTYQNGFPTMKHRVRVPDEETLFTLLGMPYIAPEQRGVAAYKRLLKKTKPSQDFIDGLIIPTQAKPTQASLF